MKKEVESTLMVRAFGNDTRFAGYRSIVDSLVFCGQTFSTELAKKMDFGPMTRFIRFDPSSTEEGLIRVFFDQAEALVSPEFEDVLAKALEEAKSESARLRNELISVERVISDLLEVESSVKEAKNVREER